MLINVAKMPKRSHVMRSALLLALGLGAHAMEVQLEEVTEDEGVVPRIQEFRVSNLDQPVLVFPEGFDARQHTWTVELSNPEYTGASQWQWYQDNVRAWNGKLGIRVEWYILDINMELGSVHKVLVDVTSSDETLRFKAAITVTWNVVRWEIPEGQSHLSGEEWEKVIKESGGERHPSLEDIETIQIPQGSNLDVVNPAFVTGKPSEYKILTLIHLIRPDDTPVRLPLRFENDRGLEYRGIHFLRAAIESQIPWPKDNPVLYAFITISAHNREGRSRLYRLERIMSPEDEKVGGERGD